MIRARAHVEGDELDVEDVVEADVGDVGLPAGDAVEAADARPGDAADARRVRSRLGRRRSSAVAGRRRSSDRLDDLLVAGAAAEVAGEALLDLGPGRVRGRARAAPAPRSAGPGCRTRTGRRRCRGTPAWSGWSRSPVGQALDGRDRRAVGLDGEHQARVDAHVVDQDGARAALADEAALLRAGQPEVVAQHLEQGVVGRDLDRRAAGR